VSSQPPFGPDPLSSVSIVTLQLDHSPLFPEPPYGPDLSPADSFIFSQFIVSLKDVHLNELKKYKMLNQLNQISSKIMYLILRNTEPLLELLPLCQRGYFEGNNVP